MLLGAPRRPEVAEAVEAPAGMRLGPVFLAGCCVALGAVPGLLVPSLMELAPQPRGLAAEPGLLVPGTGSLPSPWLLLGLVVADRAALAPARLAARRAGSRLGLRPADRAGARVELGRLHQAAAARPRGRPAAAAGDHDGSRARPGAVRQLPRRGPAPVRHGALRAGAARGPRRRPDRPPPPVRQRSRLRRLPARAAARSCSPWCELGRSDDRARRGDPGGRRPRRWRRCCRARSRRSRPACRVAAAPRRCSPTASCAGSGGRRSPTRSRPRSSTGWRRASSPPRPRWPCSCCRSPGSPRTGRWATTRSSSSACSRWPGSRSPPRAGTPARASR